MIEKTGNDLVIIASQPQELAEGHASVIEQMKLKEMSANVDLQSAQALLEQCEKYNHGLPHAQRLLKRAESRVLFLSKIREALEAGYVIVPNFQGDTIAIRVRKSKPKRIVRESTYRSPHVDDEKSEELPSGEGRYVDPEPVVERTSYLTKNAQGADERKYYAITQAFDDEFALPVEFLKPRVVELTGKMMARKIFDEVAITSNASIRDGDPMVLGRIRDRRNKKVITFLVAWFLDTKDI